MTTPQSVTPGICGYAPDPGDPCGAPAVYHFVADYGTALYGRFSCTAHAISAAQGALDYHPVGEVCGRTGTHWIRRHAPGEGFCTSDDDQHTAALADITLELTI